MIEWKEKAKKKVYLLYEDAFGWEKEGIVNVNKTARDVAVKFLDCCDFEIDKIRISLDKCSFIEIEIFLNSKSYSFLVKEDGTVEYSCYNDANDSPCEGGGFVNIDKKTIYETIGLTLQ